MTTAPASDILPHTILIVDDDEEILAHVAEIVAGAGYNVRQALSGEELYRELSAGKVDIILLDVSLPGDNGFVLCEQIRKNDQTPIILLTARAGTADRVTGLELGADDYIAKPFETTELLARIKSVLRRSQGSSNSVGFPRKVRFGEWIFDLRQRHILDCKGKMIVLSSAEVRLLKVFLENPGRILSRDDLMTLNAGPGRDTSGRALDIQISRLRQKISPLNADDQYLKTIRGRGYLFSGRVQVED